MEAFPATDVRHIKAKEARDGTDNVMKWAVEPGVHISWGYRPLDWRGLPFLVSPA